MKSLPPTDTRPEAEKVLNEVFRRMTPAEKWQRLEDLYLQGQVLHAAGYRDRHPGATPQDIHDDWLDLTLGPELAWSVKEARCENEQNLGVGNLLAQAEEQANA